MVPKTIPSAALLKARHGKARVRVAKVIRGELERIAEYTVQVELIGGTDLSFLKGDNRGVVSTDTCKNHIYLHAKKDTFESPESFALGLAKRLLLIYGHVNRILVAIEETPWARVNVDGKPHCHGFVTRSSTHGCRVVADRMRTEVVSRLSRFRVLKTTKSGWANYVKDRYTTLPETDERILATEISAEWGCREGANYQRIYEAVKAVLVCTFFGPSRSGVFSRGVQETLYLMGAAVVQEVHEVESITLSLPNLHFLPCTIEAYAKNGVKFENDVFIPSDEPRGIITATVGRSRAKL